MKKLLMTIALCTIFQIGNGQIDSATTNQLQKFEFGGLYRSSVSFNVLGVTGLVGLTYDVLLSPHWGFEAGAGYAGVGFGFEWYPWKVERGRAKPKIVVRNLYQHEFNTDLLNHSIGLGLAFFTKFRWNLAIDFGLAYPHTFKNFKYFDTDPSTPEYDDIHLMVNLKAGYRFSFQAIKYRKGKL